MNELLDQWNKLDYVDTQTNGPVSIFNVSIGENVCSSTRISEDKFFIETKTFFQRIIKSFSILFGK